MFAHKVLESYYKMLEMAGHTIDDIINNPVERIKNCPKYHFEDIESIKNLTLKKDNLFCGEYGKDLKLPFNTCWFDYIKDNKQKVGALLTEIGEKTIQIEAYVTLPDSNKYDKDFFLPCPYEVFVGLDNETQNFLENINLQVEERYKVYYRKINENVFLSWGKSEYKSDDEPAQEPVRYYNEIIQELKNINACLLLLSCKNIQAIENQPSEKLNKKRRKNKKPETMEYKTLRLVLPKTHKSRKSEQMYATERQLTTKLHLCAGHFKTYSEDAPLFGKYTGRFWWQPHVRGSEETGVVNKQYVVTPNTKS